ncbi:MAG: 16S rRNA (adenine(1518)-N(6)/adenine(1519)-N(6))-dimethyltransferase RsmA [Bacteroidota bacterium]
MVKPKKQLGQHFLTDPGIAKRICDALDNPKSLPVLEIGPGKGILTSILIERFDDFYAVETDQEACDYLTEKFPALEKNLIYKDFLQLNLDDIPGDQICLISNLPYNISSPVMFAVLDRRDKISEAVFMLQKEVARRIASGHGSKEYGILSVLMQAYFDVRYLFKVGEGSFFPPPKVQSGVIRLVRNPHKKSPEDPVLFRRVVKAAFNQRRKTLRNSLKSILLPLSEGAEGSEPWLKLRPEQCSVDDFIEISNAIGKKMHS